MSEKITLEDGTEKVVYSQEEVDAEKARLEAEFQGKLAEKDAHVKVKLDEFMQGKKSQEQKDQERDTAIAAAKASAEEAKAAAQGEKQARFNGLKNYIFEGFGSADPEVKKRLEEAYELINIPITSEEDVKVRAAKAASLAGLTGGSSQGMNAPMYGGYAPNFIKKEGPSDDEHKRFNEEIGLGDLNK